MVGVAICKLCPAVVCLFSVINWTSYHISIQLISVSQSVVFQFTICLFFYHGNLGPRVFSHSLLTLLKSIQSVNSTEVSPMCLLISK